MNYELIDFLRWVHMVLGIVLCCISALLPSLLLYFPNMEEIPFTGMLLFFGIMIVIGVLAWAGMLLITRRKGLAAVAASVWLLVLLNVGRLVPIIHDYYPLLGLKVILPVTLVFLAAATFGLSRLKEEFLNDAAKVLCLALAAFIVTSAVPQFFRSPESEEETVPSSVAEYDFSVAEGADRPNIYWIISDEYAGLEELNKYYHYDNSPFYNELRSMGFTVSDNSYNWSSNTFNILLDILNLRYINAPRIIREKEEALSDRDLPMLVLLRELGYELCEAESTNKFRFTNRLKKEVTDNSPRTADGKGVANLLLEYSILYRYEKPILRKLAPELVAASGMEAILNVFDWAENPESMREPGPNFTVIYFQSPHAPFLFDRKGKEVPDEKKLDRKDHKYYLDQLIYVTGHLKKICENILAEDPDSIIVLQSDHGHRFVANVTWLDLTNVMNAVYFRGEPLEGIEGKNALNTWITVIRKQFGLDIPEVEEKRMRNEYRHDQRDKNEPDPNAGLIPKKNK